MNKAAFASIVAIVTLINTAPASAAQSVSRSVSIVYDDLDLGNQSDLDTLDARLKKAVKEVCGNADNRRLDDVADMNRCRDAALASAARQRTIALARSNGGAPLRIAVRQN
jgi:UrcA family protein